MHCEVHLLLSLKTKDTRLGFINLWVNTLFDFKSLEAFNWFRTKGNLACHPWNKARSAPFNQNTNFHVRKFLEKAKRKCFLDGLENETKIKQILEILKTTLEQISILPSLSVSHCKVINQTFKH